MPNNPDKKDNPTFSANADYDQITLRDHVASLIYKDNVILKPQMTPKEFEQAQQVARFAYQLADEFLKARPM